MKGVILAMPINNKKDTLHKGDIVYINDWDNKVYIIKDVDPRFLKKPTEDDNPAMYILESENGEDMNFEREELTKATLGFFDADSYYTHNKYVKIGDIHPKDLRNIKFKALLEKDLHSSQINEITILDIIGLNFDGEIKKIDIKVNERVLDYHNYFQLTTV